MFNLQIVAHVHLWVEHKEVICMYCPSYMQVECSAYVYTAFICARSRPFCSVEQCSFQI